MAKISVEKAKLILERRRLERYWDFHPDKEGGLWRFLQYWDSGYFTDDKASVLKVIADSVQDVVTGKVDRLMLNCPPRTGKSYIVSLACAWALGYYPDESIMRNSVDMGLAGIFSKDVRGFIDSQKYKTVFKGVELNRINKSVNNWSLGARNRPTYSCAGVAGNSTGKGYSMMGIIDDSLGDPKDCTQKNLLDQWKWFISVMKSRRENNERMGKKAGQIIIATRWHKKDISGMLLSTQRSKWKVVKLKALVPSIDSPDAHSFCEAIHTTEDLIEDMELHRATGQLGLFLAEYQQSPIDEEGVLYHENKLNKYSKAILNGRERASCTFHIDFADTGTDFFAMPIVEEYDALDGRGTDKYFVDCIFDQSDVTVTLPKVIEMVKKYEPDRINIETNSGGKLFMDNLKKEIGKLKLRMEPTITGKYQSRNKETKILTSVGNVITNIQFLKEEERSNEYNAYMLDFTTYSKSGNNAHDDAVDSMSDMVAILRSKGSYIGVI